MEDHYGRSMCDGQANDRTPCANNMGHIDDCIPSTLCRNCIGQGCIECGQVGYVAK